MTPFRLDTFADWREPRSVIQYRISGQNKMSVHTEAIDMSGDSLSEAGDDAADADSDEINKFL